jgi:hypothetical protein
MNGFIDLLFAGSWGKKLQGALRSAGLFRRSTRI